MKSKQIRIFSDSSDLKLILPDIDRQFELRYYRMGASNTDALVYYDSLVSNEDLGSTDVDDWNLTATFLAQERLIIPVLRTIDHRDGSRRFVLDQLQNPHAVEVKPSVISTRYENVMIAGRIAIVTDEGIAGIIFKAFEKVVKKTFKKVGAFYVGPSAFTKLNQGWRLVTAVSAPREYDLRIESK